MKLIKAIFIVMCFTIIVGCGKKENSNITFDDNLIISNLTINNVKISELNSIRDILTKVKGSKKKGVTVCYKDSDECKYYPNDDFYNNQKDENISTIDICIDVGNESISTSINYSIFYNEYKDNIDTAPYFKLEFVDENDLIKLENNSIKSYTKEELNSKYEITKTSFNDAQYIYEFKNSKNDNVTLSGYFENNIITIFNYTERDRALNNG